MAGKAKPRGRQKTHAQVVRHADQPSEAPRVSLSDLSSIDLEDPCMDPVLKKYIELRREECRGSHVTSPQTLADIKHPPFVITQPYYSRPKATALEDPPVHAPMAGQTRKPEPVASTNEVARQRDINRAQPASTVPFRPAPGRHSAWAVKVPKGPPKHRKKVKATDKSSSSGGWDRGEVELRSGHLGDWSGGLGPPILEWDYRPAFRDGQSEIGMENWLDGVVEAHSTVELEIRMADYQRYIRTPEATRDPSQFDETYWARPIVPDYWAPISIGKQSPALFWREHKLSIEPPTMHDGDLNHVEPWWIEFPPHQGALLQVYEHPTIAGIDPDETRQQREARAGDKGAEEAIKVFNQQLRQKSSKHHKYPRHDTNNRHQPTNSVQNPRLIKPSIKMLIRPAVREDMYPITDIYNRYIHFAVSAPEQHVVTEEGMKERWQACQAQGLPLLVACEPSHVRKASRNRRFEDSVFIPENVIGFAYAQDYRICGDSKDVQVYTAHRYYMKGVATCLLDKMLKSLNSSYTEITNCEADVPPPSQNKSGRPGQVKNVLIHFLWDQTQPEKLAWIGSWLSAKFGFMHCSSVNAIAEKSDKESVNITIFRKTLT